MWRSSRSTLYKEETMDTSWSVQIPRWTCSPGICATLCDLDLSRHVRQWRELNACTDNATFWNVWELALWKCFTHNVIDYPRRLLQENEFFLWSNVWSEIKPWGKTSGQLAWYSFAKSSGIAFILNFTVSRLLRRFGDYRLRIRVSHSVF